jgi:hypothetical protein
MLARGGKGSIFDRLQVEGSKFLKTVEAEIRERQSELDDLREKASHWLVAMGGAVPKRRGRYPGSGKKAGSVAAPKATLGGAVKKAAKPKRKSPAVDWEKVLAKLPKSFTMDDVAKATPALKEHTQARVIAVARWSRFGAIKKLAPGKYTKAGKRAA